MITGIRPGTTINIVDQPASTNVIEDTIVRPLFLQLFTADKGPENLTTASGNDFFKMYGSTPSFKKHGQPLIQAASIIKAGGELLCKRVVANDSTLANLIVVAKISKEEVQKVDGSGKPLFIDAVTGKETTDDNGGQNQRVLINTARIKYDAVSVKDAKSINEIKTHAQQLIKDEVDIQEYTGYDTTTKVGDPLTDLNPVGQVADGDEDADKYIYPLFVITDNGRGVSSKRFKITPDYSVSKNQTFQLYKLQFIGDVESENEYVWFNFQDNIIYLNKNRSLDMIGKEMLQIKAATLDNSVDLFVSRLSEITGIDVDTINSIDALFGTNRKGEPIPQIAIDSEGYDLKSDLGMMLQEGTNGSFGDSPINAITYGEQMVKVLNGTDDDSIYDRDRFMIDVCVDANYPMEVKNAIYDLAKYREDFVYLRDFGTDVTTFEAVTDISYNLPKSKFIADYYQSWDVIDPWTKKQITVTAPYSIAPKLVSHLVNKRSAPLCGILHDFTFPDAIEGTVSFIPKVVPTVDQKVLFSDANINYASYINNTLTLETCFTNQEEGKTQYGFINNVLAVTKVIHDIRTECPKIRYAFITDTDLDKYQDDVNKVIQRSKNEFDEIYMEYVQDEVMAANKIFEADIFVKFKNFTMAEIFNIYTLNA